MDESDCDNKEQKAYYGFVTDIIPQWKNIRVEFQILFDFPLHSLWPIYKELSIACVGYGLNEFDWTHWTIKQVDLLNELKIAGIFGSDNALTI